MKATLFSLFVALLMVGCGEEAQKEAVQEEAKDDPSVPLLIPCEACGKEVSKKTEKCLNCGHPAPDSVVAYKEAQELEQKRREEAKAQAKQLGLNDHTFILNAVDWDDKGFNYTGWVKETYDNGKISCLYQLKDGINHGLWIRWYDNCQKCELGSFKDGKLGGLWTLWYRNGQKKKESTYKEGTIVTTVGWKPNGEKCPVTNVKDGNGVTVRYNEDGTESSRYTYKDGEVVD